MNPTFVLRWQRPVCQALFAGLACAFASGAGAALLQQDPDEAPWQEGEVPAAPAFNADKTVGIDVSLHSELSYGIDPSTLTVGADGVVRYVLVARSRQGALNVLYEGLRCASAEVKTYAHWNPGTPGAWQSNREPQWRALTGHAASGPARALAHNGLCDGVTPNGNPDKMLRDLRYGKRF